jgi:hypothetical protein
MPVEADLASMKKLEFVATVGDARFSVTLVEPQGASAGYQVLVDNWLQGTLVIRNGVWVAQLNRRSFLTADDICILRELVDEVALKE